MSRKPRAQYLSLNDALHDDTQPEFDPRDLSPGYSTPAKPDDSFLKTPLSPSLFPHGIPKPAARHPFARDFEAPDWTLIFIHIGFCLLAYPVLMIFTAIARERPLFWTRFFVGMGSMIVGFFLGLSLIQLGQKFLESAVWATVIHQSRVIDGPGIKLKDLAANTEDPTSAWVALRLLWDRYLYEGTSRQYRKGYDRRPWTLFILFFLLIVGVGASLSFVFGRIIQIDTTVKHQRESYYEVAVKGGSSDADIERVKAIAPAFDDFTLTWTLAPFSDHGGLPPVVSFKWNNDSVYFSETVASQLLPDGSGFGTFDTSTIDPSKNVDSKGHWQNSTSSVSNDMDPGSILRFPRWGIRMHCAKIPDGENNLIIRAPSKNYTYVFTPRETLRSLFSSFDREYPTIAPFDPSTVLQLNDTLPPRLNVSETALGAYFYDNGVAHSFKSDPLSLGQKGFGWVSIEHVLVRLNNSYAPNGTFLRMDDLVIPDKDGKPTSVGYDAAVCLELFEPWIVETYNSTIGLPTSVRLVQPGSEVKDMNNAQLKEKRKGRSLADPSVSRQLNSSKLRDVYLAAHQNSINQMLKDNGRDFYYVPNPTIISYTNGKGPHGYTELSASYFAQARSLADATNILPYFVGSGDALARRYPDSILARASIDTIAMCAYLAFVLLVGLLAGLFVPKLPLDVPHRGFEVYSWVAAFQADELVSERELDITRNMDLDEIAYRTGNLKFRYVNNSN